MSDLARVVSLHSYPIKGCAGTSHSVATVDRRGLAFDRAWMITDGDGQFVTQRQAPRLALITPTLEREQLNVQIVGVGAVTVPLETMSSGTKLVTVWGDRCVARDEGDDVAALLREHLGQTARLVRMSERHVRAVPGSNAQTGFADAFPLLVISTSSLADVNARIVDRGGQAVAMERFRPNVVVDGCEAYAEDRWADVMVGDVALTMAGPCERCTVTTVDQASGTVTAGGEPLATLATYRRGRDGVVFGQNAVHRGAGTIAVADTVRSA